MKTCSSQYPDSFRPVYTAGIPTVGVHTTSGPSGTGIYKLPTHDHGVRVEVRTCTSALQKVQAEELGLPPRKHG